MGAGSTTAPLVSHGEAKTASGLSNHSLEPDHVCAALRGTARIEPNGEFVIVTAKLS